MADLHEDDDNHHLHLHDVPILISPQNNHLPHHLHEFDVFPLDLDLSSSQHFLHRRINRIAPPISSLDRQNHLNFVSDMFHQRVEQSQSQSQSQPHSASSNIDSDRSFRVIEENDDIIWNQFEADFGPGLGLGFLIGNSDNPNFDDDNHSGFIIADSVDSSQLSGLSDGDCDEEEASFQLCWDSFHLEDEIPNPNSNSNSNSNANANANANANGHEDFEWEEVDDDAPVLLTAFEVEQPTEQPEPEHGPEALEWQVLSNVNSFEPSPDSEDESEDYNYTEYEMLFGQFADGDASLSGRPPASRTVVVSLSTVVVSEEDVVKNNAVCAVCKDEVVVGELMTQLPCGHRYHGCCILPWLAVRNTCPVCRHELPTDDPDYERRKAERG